MTYTPAEVISAAARQGFDLEPTDVRLAPFDALSGEAFAPRTGDSFTVYVMEDADADGAWTDLVAIRPQGDSLDVRRANVVVVSNGGLERATRFRVVASLWELPDRGLRVDVLTTRL